MPRTVMVSYVHRGEFKEEERNNRESLGEISGEE